MRVMSVERDSVSSSEDAEDRWCVVVVVEAGACGGGRVGDPGLKSPEVTASAPAELVRCFLEEGW